MPKGKRELFHVDLFLDRPQRKILDEVLQKASRPVGRMVAEALRQADLGVLTNLRGFEGLSNTVFCDQTLNEGTRLELAKLACEKYALMVSGAISSERGRNPTGVCIIAPDQVIFGMTERIVRIPYIGPCKFVYNNKAMTRIGELIALTKTGIRYSLGYWNNRPTLTIDTKAPPVLEPAFVDKDQKLVRVTASELVRRRKAGEKVPPSNPEST